MNGPEWDAYLKSFDLSSDHFQGIQKETNKHCVIIEPRSDPRLILVVKNFMKLLQSHNWGLILIHGNTNDEFVRSGFSGWPNIQYIRISVDNLTAKSYSDLLCSNVLWNMLLELGCEHALIFQIDTVLLRSDIDRFLEYDYVGAPWNKRWFGIELGNGGLSLRCVRKMLEITEKCPRTVNTMFGVRYLENEDIFFTFHLKYTMCANIPPVEIASQFSVETIYYPTPCGMHQPHIGEFPDYESFAKMLKIDPSLQ